MSETKKYVFDLNALTYNDIQKMDLMQSGEQEEYAIRLVVKALHKWPFPKDISEENIRGLGLIDFSELQEAFTSELEKVFKRDRGTQ